MSAISTRLEKLGLSVSPSRTASIVYRPRGRLNPAQVPLFLDDQQIQRLRICKHHGLTIDDKFTWRPAFAETVALSRTLLSTFRQAALQGVRLEVQC